MRLSIRPKNGNVTDSSVSEVTLLFNRSRQRQEGVENWILVDEEWDEFARITHTRSEAAFVEWRDLYSNLSRTDERKAHRNNASHLTVVRDI